ncbi:MAG: ABC transporter substrate-binding protein [Actinomycetaceae bacterium]|nr:ABC transporter substrate-binding protein [Actinomycetaceae bacterium]MDY6083584.1 ABC transporter substrate-binding protein [Actinomycetaceae bacterium]
MKNIHMTKLLVVFLGGMLAVSGCSSTGSTAETAKETSTASAPAEGQWPRTVTIGSSDVKIAAAPKRIVALSTETTDLIIELGGSDRLVGVSKGSQTQGTGNDVEKATAVKAAFRADGKIDPEQVLALSPDLVVLTKRQDADDALMTALKTAGVTVAAFPPAAFASLEAVADSTKTLGKVLGEEDKAASIVDNMTKRSSAVDKAVASVKESPRTLALMSRGPQHMIMSQSTATMALVKRAGGTSIAAEKGWRQSVPVNPELLVSLKPDVILVQDFEGEGLAPFKELLDNPALADIPAIAGHKVYLIAAQTTSGTSGAHLAEGFAQIAQLLHPQLASTLGASVPSGK